MNTIRMIAITLPMTLLLACGGGGGASSTAVAPTTTPPTNMPGTDDPMTPGTGDPNMPPMVVEFEDLPTALIDATTARSRVTGSTSPTTNLDSTQIQSMFRSRATNGDRVTTSDTYVVTPTTPSGMDMSGSSINLDGATFTASLSNIATDIGDRFELLGVRSEYSSVMVHERATLAQHRAAGRNDDSDVFEYLSYGGWFVNSAFSVDMLTINDGSNESSLLVGISYGDATGSRPTARGTFNWGGSLVGVNKSSGDIIQGRLDMEVVIAGNLSPRANLNFENIVNITNGSSLPNIHWQHLFIATNGTFSSTTGGDINGTFYGANQAEVGGTINRDGIIGAFGGTRQ